MRSIISAVLVVLFAQTFSAASINPVIGKQVLRFLLCTSLTVQSPTTSLAVSQLATAPSEQLNKQFNASPSIVSETVAADITERQALITADFTRSLYSEDATFKDEIDTYPLDKYIKGTKALFVAKKSHVDLTSPVTVDAKKAAFTFEETLAFNIPPLYPSVHLTGNVELFRGPDGLITRSVEHWDQPPAEVLKTAQFFQ
jgi:hypothetical protein